MNLNLLFVLLALVAAVLAIIAAAVPASILFTGVLTSVTGWAAVSLALYYLSLLLPATVSNGAVTR